MTLRARLYAGSDPTEGSRILYRRFHAGVADISDTGPHPVLPEAAPAPSYRIGRLTPCSPLIVAAQAGVPLLSHQAGRRRNRVVL